MNRRTPPRIAQELNCGNARCSCPVQPSGRQAGAGTFAVGSRYPTFSRAWACRHLGESMLRQSKRPVVLVVEDEALVRLGAASMVEDAGYEVIEAANADQAVKILETRDDIRVVFTDINMPGSMDGLKLAAAVRDRWPPIEIIVTTGRGLPNMSVLPERARVLMKPYLPFELEQALAALTAT